MDHTVVATTATQTHDFSEGRWGHNAEITRVVDGGVSLRLAVWTRANLRVGDYLILSNSGGTTRYWVDSIERQRDPVDMSFAGVSFAPRSPDDCQERSKRVP